MIVINRHVFQQLVLVFHTAFILIQYLFYNLVIPENRAGFLQHLEVFSNHSLNWIPHAYRNEWNITGGAHTWSSGNGLWAVQCRLQYAMIYVIIM